MEQKIQELTDKIYQEGVEKGELRARQLVVDAESKAASIVADAKIQAEKLLSAAQNNAAELKRNTESELRLSGLQAVSAVKQQVLNLVSAKVIEDSVSSSFSDPATVKEFVASVLQNWKFAEGESPRLEVLLPLHKQEELKLSFEKSASSLLDKGIELNFSKNIKAGFRIGPVNGTYRISLTDEDFHEFFKEYLRPRTRQYLFGE
jgi:V/A-type H+-transporting ATPase subunit E